MLNKKNAAACGLILMLTVSSAVPALADENTVSEDWDAKAVTMETGYVNIRAGAGTEESLVGVLLPGSVVEILGRKNEWTRIHSGNVDGFIRSDLLVSGEEAKKAYESCTAPACGTVSADVLCVRSGKSASDGILGIMLSGERLNFTGYEDGWYEIEYNGEKAYVAEQYVTPGDKVETALTMEEFETLSSQGMIPVPQEDTTDDGTVPEETAPAEEVLPAAVLPEVTETYYAETPVYTETADAVYDNASLYTDTSAYTDSSASDAAAYTDTNAYTDAYADVNTAADAGTYTDAALYGETDASAAAAPADNLQESVYTDNTYADSTYTDAAYTDSTYTDTAAGTTGVSSSDLDLLAAIIQCEAGGESYEGKVAVGACVLNRMESDSFPDTISDVVYQSGQFTPAMTGTLDQTLAEGARADCYEAAQAALAGENPIGDLLFFHAGGGDGLTIGNQTFY